MEQGLSRQSIPVAINRAGYYLTNWESMLDPVRNTGVLPTMLPADFAMPMVAPSDLGEAAADRLLSSTADVGVRAVEGPRRCTPADVAAAFAKALGRTVSVAVTPRDQWRDAFRKLGFSAAAAESYAGMTAATIDGGFDPPMDSIRGATTLEAYIQAVVDRPAASA